MNIITGLLVIMLVVLAVPVQASTVPIVYTNIWSDDQIDKVRDLIISELDLAPGKFHYKTSVGGLGEYYVAYVYSDGYIIISDNGYIGVDSPLRNCLEPGELAKRVATILANAAGISMSFNTTSRGDTIILTMLIAGVPVWYNTTIRLDKSDCRVHIEAWTPTNPVVESIETSYEPSHVLLAPRGNTSMGVNLYPYITVANGTTILVMDDEAMPVTTIWFYPDTPNYTRLRQDARTTRIISQTFLTIAYFTIIMLVALLVIKKKILANR